MEANHKPVAEVLRYRPKGLFSASNDNDPFASDAEIYYLHFKMRRIKKQYKALSIVLPDAESAWDDIERVRQWVVCCIGAYMFPERKMFNEGVRLVELAEAILAKCSEIGDAINHDKSI